ncbi:MAG TPA: class I SAM-dependent methyltransferase [Burkholderiales bacterium]|nr:class I SAM-dependent methyltransferase [Burkholderiales bacterium]
MFRAIPKGILSVLAAVLLAAAPAAYAQDKDFKPHIGQPGKDVVWVPTPNEVVERMLNMAQTKPEDYVIDLGAGDGKIAIAAVKKFGARSLGVEYNPDMAALAQRNAQAAGVSGKAQIVQGDIFVTDFTQATVLTMYLLPSINMRLRPQILAMRPGTRVVTHAFNMEDWEPDETSDVDGRRVYLWIVPANVSGRWALELSGAGGSEKLSLNLDQKYQKIEGMAYLGAILAGLREPRLSGFRISFAYVDNNGVRRDFTGRVIGSTMEGSFRTDGGAEGRWTAARK